MSLYLGNKQVSAGVYIETDRVVLSAAEYETLEVKDPNTLYFIHDDPTLKEVCEHITDGDVHVTAEEKEQFLNAGHTDEEILELAESVGLKKELLSQTAVSFDVAYATKNILLYTLSPTELTDLVALIIEFDGTIQLVSSYYDDGQSVGVQITDSASYNSSPLFSIFSKTGIYTPTTYIDKYARCFYRTDGKNLMYYSNGITHTNINSDKNLYMVVRSTITQNHIKVDGIVKIYALKI